MPKPEAKVHPLLAAILAELPARGTVWPSDARADWLRMLETAIDVVYGRSDVARADVARAVSRKVDETFYGGQAGGSMTAPPANTAKPEHGGHDYYIDNYNCVRRDPGAELVLSAEDVPAGEVIYDYRRGSARDRDTIVWGDGSIGAGPGMEFCGPG